MTDPQQPPGVLPLRAVIFDLYGTLVDLRIDEDRPAFWENLAGDFFGSHSPIGSRALESAYRGLLAEHARHGRDGFLLDGVFRALLAHLGVDSTPENIARFSAAFRRHSIAVLRKKDYTDDLLAALKRAGILAGLGSNTEALLTAYDLQTLHLSDRLDGIVLSSAVKVAKPDPRFFAACLQQLGVACEEAVFVGDSFEADVKGASNAGLRAVYLSETGLPPGASVPGERVGLARFSLAAIAAALARFGVRLDL